MNKQNKLLVVCGPTATGKTQLGIHLSKKFNGEIVSADSRQVYKGMDIATGKDDGTGVKIWMLDVVRPDQEFSVAQYVWLAEKAIKDIRKRGRLPIIVGGTGLYIKAIVDGIDTLGVVPNPQLRMAYSDKSAQELFDLLFHLNPEVANGLNHDDRQNKRRLIRKLEIAQTGLPVKNEKERPNPEVLFLGLTTSLPKLYQRIDRRTDNWVKEGAEKELRKLLNHGYSWTLPSMSGIGYRQWKPYFEREATSEEVIQRWKFDEHSYARRQMTWFKKDGRMKWFDISEQKWENEIEKLVSVWVRKK